MTNRLVIAVLVFFVCGWMCASHNWLFSYMQSLKFCHSTSEKLQNVSDQQICLIFVQKSTSVNILQLLGSFDTDSVLGHHCELGLRPSVTFSLFRSPLTVPTLVFVHFNDWMYTNKPYTNTIYKLLHAIDLASRIQKCNSCIVL